MKRRMRKSGLAMMPNQPKLTTFSRLGPVTACTDPSTSSDFGPANIRTLQRACGVAYRRAQHRSLIGLIRIWPLEIARHVDRVVQTHQGGVRRDRPAERLRRSRDRSRPPSQTARAASRRRLPSSSDLIVFAILRCVDRAHSRTAEACSDRRSPTAMPAAPTQARHSA